EAAGAEAREARGEAHEVRRLVLQAEHARLEAVQGVLEREVQHAGGLLDLDLPEDLAAAGEGEAHAHSQPALAALGVAGEDVQALSDEAGDELPGFGKLHLHEALGGDGVEGHRAYLMADR